MFDYAKEGLGAYKSVLPPICEKIEAQLQANMASQDEIEKFIERLRGLGKATLKFTERRYRFFS